MRAAVEYKWLSKQIACCYFKPLVERARVDVLGSWFLRLLQVLPGLQSMLHGAPENDCPLVQTKDLLCPRLLDGRTCQLFMLEGAIFSTDRIKTFGVKLV
jgi:hypothetical protein